MNSQTMSCVRSQFSDAQSGVSTTDRRKPATSSGAGRKTLSAVLIGSIFAAGPLAAQAIEAKVSGQVNRALMQVDDGTNSELHNVDNATSSTRFRFTGSADVMPGTKAGIVFEAEFMSNASNVVTQAAKSSPASLEERIMNVFFQNSVGTFTLGQGPGASDGGIEVDLSGTDVVQGALAASSLGGGIAFVGGPTIGNSISDQDFESRYDRFRYDSPNLGPIGIALSKGVKDDVDVSEVALRLSTDVAGGKLAAAVGSSTQDTTPTKDEVTGGSVSWLMPNGLNFTYAMSSRDSGGRERDFNYFKIGYKFGRSAIALDLGKGENQSAAGAETEMTGIGYVYSPQKWAELYVGYKTFGFNGAGVNDISIITAGSRLKF